MNSVSDISAQWVRRLISLTKIGTISFGLPCRFRSYCTAAGRPTENLWRILCQKNRTSRVASVWYGFSSALRCSLRHSRRTLMTDLPHGTCDHEALAHYVHSRICLPLKIDVGPWCLYNEVSVSTNGIAIKYEELLAPNLLRDSWYLRVGNCDLGRLHLLSFKFFGNKDRRE